MFLLFGLHHRLKQSLSAMTSNSNTWFFVTNSPNHAKSGKLELASSHTTTVHVPSIVEELSMVRLSAAHNSSIATWAANCSRPIGVRLTRCWIPQWHNQSLEMAIVSINVDLTWAGIAVNAPKWSWTPHTRPWTLLTRPFNSPCPLNREGDNANHWGSLHLKPLHQTQRPG